MSDEDILDDALGDFYKFDETQLAKVLDEQLRDCKELTEDDPTWGHVIKEMNKRDSESEAQRRALTIKTLFIVFFLILNRHVFLISTSSSCFD